MLVIYNDKSSFHNLKLMNFIENFIILFTAKCGPDLIFKQCGPNVERNCDNSVEDTSVCVAGCFCPNGMAKHGGKCIQLDNCPCTNFINLIIDEGSQMRNTCKCEKGVVNCKTESFTRKRCSVVGDPHFTTFDNSNYDFMGTGLYRLLDTDNMNISSNFVQCKNFFFYYNLKFCLSDKFFL